MLESNQRLKDLSEIGIVIDTWDDIFSDFDPSPLYDRTLSVDFIEEVKKRYRERITGNIYLTINVPESLSSPTAEKVVLSRIHEYFDFRLKDVKDDRNGEIKRGLLFCLGGFAVLSLFAVLKSLNIFGPLTAQIFELPLEVLGWFLMFEGYTFFAIPAKEFYKERDLFKKLRDAEYHFSYVPQNDRHIPSQEHP